jgi:hypothetical protein
MYRINIEYRIQMLPDMLKENTQRNCYQIHTNRIPNMTAFRHRIIIFFIITDKILGIVY